MTAPRRCSCHFWPSAPWPCSARRPIGGSTAFSLLRDLQNPENPLPGSWSRPSFPTWAAIPPWASWPSPTTPACAPRTCTRPAAGLTAMPNSISGSRRASGFHRCCWPAATRAWRGVSTISTSATPSSRRAATGCSSSPAGSGPSPPATLGLDLVVNADSRDSLFAEDGRYPQETYAQDKRSWLAGAAWSGRAFNLKFSWLHEGQELQPAVADAGKDLQDIDGQGFFPFEKWGEFRADTLALAADGKLEFSWLGKTRGDRALPGPVPCFCTPPAKRPGRTMRSISPDSPTWSIRGRARPRMTTATSGARPRPGPCSAMELGRGIGLHARLFLQFQGLGFQGRGQ